LALFSRPPCLTALCRPDGGRRRLGADPRAVRDTELSACRAGAWVGFLVLAAWRAPSASPGPVGAGDEHEDCEGDTGCPGCGYIISLSRWTATPPARTSHLRSHSVTPRRSSCPGSRRRTSSALLRSQAQRQPRRA